MTNTKKEEKKNEKTHTKISDSVCKDLKTLSILEYKHFGFILFWMLL